MLKKLKNAKLYILCTMLLSVIILSVSLNQKDDDTVTKTPELRVGYEILIDSKSVCVLDSKENAETLVEELLSKAVRYYGTDGKHSFVNKIDIVKGEFHPAAFYSENEAERSMGTNVVLGAPTVRTIAGEKITVSMTDTSFTEKYVETDFETRYEYTYGVNQSYEKIISEGKKGTVKQLYERKEIDGKTVSETLVWESVLNEPETQVIEIGVTPSMQLASAELAYFIKPYDGTISSDYGYRYLNGYEFHTGIDLVAKSGSCYGKTAVAAADGVVVESGYSSSRGNYVIIEHEYGFSTVYMHFKKRLVSKGDQVKAGDPIGTIGSTGRSTGAHLHFEIRLNGKHTDPENYLSFK